MTFKNCIQYGTNHFLETIATNKNVSVVHFASQSWVVLVVNGKLSISCGITVTYLVCTINFCSLIISVSLSFLPVAVSINGQSFICRFSIRNFMFLVNRYGHFPLPVNCIMFVTNYIFVHILGDNEGTEAE